MASAQTVLDALDNLHKSYTGQKVMMNETLNSIIEDIKIIEICTTELITNFGEKKELAVKLEKSKSQFNKAMNDANVSKEDMKNINVKIQDLMDTIFKKEQENLKLAKKIKTTTDHMKNMCDNKEGSTVEQNPSRALQRQGAVVDNSVPLIQEVKVPERPVPTLETKQTETDVNALDGGYKHSSRKSRSKSTRRRVKNKFKKIKIFSKKKGSKNRYL